MSEPSSASRTFVLADGAFGLKDAGLDPDAPILVTIENGKITALANAGASDGAVPPDAEGTLLDFRGHVLIPGLIDAHVHLAAQNCISNEHVRLAFYEVTPALAQMQALLHAQLSMEMGYTTLRDMSWISPEGPLHREMIGLRQAIDQGMVAGPRILTAGWAITTGSHLDLLLPRSAVRWRPHTADGADGVRGLARERLREGVDFVKTTASGGGGTDRERPDIRNSTPEELAAIADEAHGLGKLAACHCFTPEAQLRALGAGMDTLEHCVWTSDEALERLVETRTPIVPTLLHRTDHAIAVCKAAGISKYTLDKMRRIQEHCFRTFQRAYEAGAVIAMGTDLARDPEAGTNSKELEIYVELGMKPTEALESATSAAAAAIGLGKKTGSVAVGMAADLVAVKGDPRVDISLLQKRECIGLVMKEGLAYIDRRPGHDRKEIIASRAWQVR